MFPAGAGDGAGPAVGRRTCRWRVLGAVTGVLCALGALAVACGDHVPPAPGSIGRGAEASGRDAGSGPAHDAAAQAGRDAGAAGRDGAAGERAFGFDELAVAEPPPEPDSAEDAGRDHADAGLAAGWRCGFEQRGRGDGCNCGCGAPDPDCAPRAGCAAPGCVAAGCRTCRGPGGTPRSCAR